MFRFCVLKPFIPKKYQNVPVPRQIQLTTFPNFWHGRWNRQPSFRPGELVQQTMFFTVTILTILKKMPPRSNRYQIYLTRAVKPSTKCPPGRTRAANNVFYCHDTDRVKKKRCRVRTGTTFILKQTPQVCSSWPSSFLPHGNSTSVAYFAARIRDDHTGYISLNWKKDGNHSV